MLRILAKLVRLGFWMRSLALVAPLLVIGQVWQSGRHSTASRLAWIESLSDRDAAREIERLTPADASAVRLLVALMGSQRVALASQSREALFDEYDRWRRLPSDQLEPRLALLAEALAERIDALGPHARDSAAELAESILRRSQRQRLELKGKTVDACEKVMRSTWRAGRSPAVSQSSGEDPGERLPASYALGRPSMEPTFGSSTQTLLAALDEIRPVSGLPVTPYEGRQRRDAAAANEIANEIADADPAPSDFQSPRSGAASADLALADSAAPRLLAEHETRRARPLGGGLMRSGNPAPDGEERHDETLQAANSDPSDAAGAATDGPAIDPLFRLLQQLNHRSATARVDAETELSRRGFTPGLIELGRQLTSPQVAVRRRLAQTLPRARGIDLPVWLLWLAQDDDAEVRLSALGILATLRDPDLLDRVEQLAQSDSDPRIQEQGQRLHLSRNAAPERGSALRAAALSR